jgi:hypothetical protein
VPDGCIIGLRTHLAITKSRIIERLGEAGVLLPSPVAEGLAANDRVKVHLSTLQAAADHARNQGTPAPDLTAECRAAGIDPVPVSRLISEAKISADGRVTAPHLPELGKRGAPAAIGGRSPRRLWLLDE